MCWGKHDNPSLRCHCVAVAGLPSACDPRVARAIQDGMGWSREEAAWVRRGAW